jgi:hypothetical protein
MTSYTVYTMKSSLKVIVFPFRKCWLKFSQISTNDSRVQQICGTHQNMAALVLGGVGAAATSPPPPFIFSQVAVSRFNARRRQPYLRQGGHAIFHRKLKFFLSVSSLRLWLLIDVKGLRIPDH